MTATCQLGLLQHPLEDLKALSDLPFHAALPKMLSWMCLATSLRVILSGWDFSHLTHFSISISLSSTAKAISHADTLWSWAQHCDTRQALCLWGRSSPPILLIRGRTTNTPLKSFNNLLPSPSKVRWNYKHFSPGRGTAHPSKAPEDGAPRRGTVFYWRFFHIFTGTSNLSTRPFWTI